MQSRISTTQLCFGLLLVANFLLANVHGQENCISCNSTNEFQPECGLAQDPLTTGVTTEACTGTFECYSQIYPSTASPTVWFTKRGCLDENQACPESSCRSCKSGDNCNTEPLTVDRHQCLKCLGDDCSNTTAAFCDNYNEGATDCVTLFDQIGLPVYRSCYDDLPEETKILCDTEGYIDCAKCTGKNCNLASTRNGTKCHKCSGIDCLVIDSPATLVDCQSSCYVGVNDLGQPERGCSADFENAGICSTDEASTNPCFVCEEDGCNDIVYPSVGRLVCRTCVEGDCTISEDNVEYCAVYNGDEKCASVFDVDNEVIARGCISTLSSDLQAECSSGSANCLQCTYDKCNIDDSMRKTDFCIGCNSRDDPNCLKENPTTEVRCSTNQCYTRLMEQTDEFYGRFIERGCLADLEAVTTCSSPDCSSCTGNNCNVKKFPENRISCKSCEFGSCNGFEVDAICSTYSPSEACFTFFGDDGDVNYRGCYSDAPNGTRALCDDSTNLECTKCTGNLCNTDVKRRGNRCFKCEGFECFKVNQESLVDCASGCYNGIDEMGYPKRDCAVAVSNSGDCGVTDSSCTTCYEDYCNAVVLSTANRLTCLKCVGEGCENGNAVSEYCERLDANERCVTVFDATGVVAERGCSSSVQNAAICNAEDPSCHKCDFNDCNVDVSTSQIAHCVLCNSIEDINCVSNPLLSQTAACTTSQCFTSLMPTATGDGGQHIQRGCGTSVSNCTSPTCSTCSGERCNKEVYPSDRNTCNFCVGSQCLSNSLQEKRCIQYSSMKSCITVFGAENEVIYRDCYADAANGTRDYCDGTGLGCIKCTGKNCNTDTVRKGTKCFKCEGAECWNVNQESLKDCSSECYNGMTALGFPKRDCASAVANSGSCGVTDLNCYTCNQDFCNGIVFPTQGRLTCLKCVGEGCNNANAVSEYCERLDSNERCVTIFDSTGAVAERGCSSSVRNVTLCSSNDPKCHKCSFDECNVDSATNQIAHCVLCNSKDDKNCVFSPNVSQTIACTTNQCFSALLPTVDGDSGQHIQRGCRTAMTTCSSSSCTSCTGERCNTGVYPADRNTCNFCVGSQCSSTFLQEKRCLFYHPTKNCITVFGSENEVIYRDCYADAVKGTRDYCDGSNLGCTKCVGKNCNNDTVRRGTKCLKCEGVECLYASDRSDSIECESGGCYIGLNSAGDTKRDCASAVEGSSTCARNETANSTCLVCNDDYCNDIVFPVKNRLICKDCVGYSCEDNVLEEKYCERISSNERCVSLFDRNDKILERGCLSSLLNSSSCKSSNANCVRCNFSLCNTHETKTAVNFCVACDSREDPNCATNTTLPRTKTCSTAECYTRLVPSTSDPQWMHVVKGCAADLPTTVSCTDGACHECSGDRCNNILYPTSRISCLNCRGNDCKNAFIPSKVCDPYSRQKQACVTLFDNEGEVNYRGCYSEAAEGTKSVCDDSSQLMCTKCASKNCNTATKWRGHKCFKCNGLGCFNPTFPGDTIDCLSDCYMGINSRGETVRACSSDFTNTTACGTTDDGLSRCQVCSDDYCNGLQFPVNNRLKCFTCSGDNCDPSDENLSYCGRYSAQERCVTAFSSDNKVIERSCSSELINDAYCRLSYKNCINCAGSGCNNIASLSVRMCAVCDSSTDPNCVLSPGTVGTKNCETGCYTRLINGTLHRGCYEDLGDTFECSEKNKCEYCNAADKCNVEKYPLDRRSCHHCISSASCANSTSQLCVNYEEYDSCVTIFDQYSVSMKGCSSDQTSTNQALCNGNDPRCSSCSSSSNCNTDIVRRDDTCITCNSALEPRCAQEPTKLTPARCFLPSNGQCYTRLIGGATDRGCQSGLTSSCSGTNCTLSASGSNNKIMPESRRKCYQCNSDVDAGCLEIKNDTSISSLPCVRFLQPEACIKIVLNTTIIRGCVADYSTSLCEEGKCYDCKKDNCNSGSLVKISILSAILPNLIFLKYLSKN